MYSLLLFAELMGGLGLFLYGMRVMSDSIQRRSSGKMKNLLSIFTSNRFAGVLTGLLVTSVIQSSSATTVLLVSIVNAGLISLQQSIGVIMGANIGTTLTGWIVSILGFKFQINALALPAVALGTVLFFSKKEKRREWGGIFIGFGILFLGLHVMKESVPDIKNNPEILAFLAHFSEPNHLNLVVFILVGTLLTICVQSSSAAMAITITMAFKGWIGFPTAAAIILGENIGTTITAYLAALGMNVNAKRAARAHMLFNLIGIAWMFLLFIPFLNMIEAVIPGSAENAANIPIHLSAFHTAFNLVNTVLLIGFVPQITRLAERLVPSPTDGNDGRLAFVGAQTSEDLESNLISVHSELVRMASIIQDMSLWVMKGLQEEEGSLQATQNKIIAFENETDEIQRNISRFLTACMVAQLSEEQANQIRATYRVSHELENIGDSCRSVMKQLMKRATKKLEFHHSGILHLAEYHTHVMEFIHYIVDCLKGSIEPPSIETAKGMEKNINRQRNKLRKMVRKLIAEGADVRGELIFLDIVRHLEQIGDASYNISQELTTRQD